MRILTQRHILKILNDKWYSLTFSWLIWASTWIHHRDLWGWTSDHGELPILVTFVFKQRPAMSVTSTVLHSIPIMACIMSDCGYIPVVTVRGMAHIFRYIYRSSRDNMTVLSAGHSVIVRNLNYWISGMGEITSGTRFIQMGSVQASNDQSQIQRRIFLQVPLRLFL